MTIELFEFKGGVHPDDKKGLSKNSRIEVLEASDIVRIPLSQHIGAPAKPIVKKGDAVLVGQVVGEAGGFVSAPVHSSVSGTVKSIANFVAAPFGVPSTMVEIENDGKYKTVEFNENKNYMDLDPKKLLDIIKNAGIVGMGGATFPTHVKLSPPPDFKIDTFIVNGVECELYLTADYRLMLEEPEKIIEGSKIVMKILGVEKGVIAIEGNKPDCIEKMSRMVENEPIEVIELPVKYPQGGEKQLIKAITNKEVPSGGLPMHVGAVVQNAGTVAAIYEAVRYGKPLIERITTVSGEAIKKPKNFKVRIGTLASHLIDNCEGFKKTPKKIIFGGPMTGFAQYTLEIPVTKGTSGILAFTDDLVKEYDYSACISCGSCVRACPANLVPSVMSILIEKGLFEDADKNDVLDCIECGCCSYVCPAHRPLVQMFKLGKAKAMEIRRAKQK
jgi:electron transport complex protein RnfC